MPIFTLLRNANVYAPNPLGQQDLLIAGRQIAALEPHLEIHSEQLEIE